MVFNTSTMDVEVGLGKNYPVSDMQLNQLSNRNALEILRSGGMLWQVTPSQGP